jgi:hypothetical protein
VHAGAIPALVSLLSSPGTDVQYYGTAVLSNIAVDGPSIILLSWHHGGFVDKANLGSFIKAQSGKYWHELNQS